MASPTELDIFNRSLGGDRRARTELYKKFIYGNTRVVRLGGGYSDINDFLHDCFTNLLRTGHSWDTNDSLTKWVESVAVWTALVNARQRDMHSRGAQGEIRMCAEIEGEDATHKEVLAAYAPPHLGAEDSPAQRVFAILNETEKVVLNKRVRENASWEQIASATGKPLNAIGQIFARVTARISRLFGAPPPMDDDLVPVVSRVFAKPMNPEGRAISLHLDRTFYALTPELQAIGVKTAYEARMLVLWDAAQQSTPPGDPLRRHLDKCHYCADLLRSLLLMQQALTSPPGIEFHLCPGAFTLANAPDLVREEFDQHLAQCSICRDERTKALDGQAPRQVDADTPGQAAAGAGRKVAIVVAAIALVGVGSIAGYHYFGPQKDGPSISVLTPGNSQPTVTVDPRYKDLVQDVPMDDTRVMATVLPANHAAMKYALDRFALGETTQALMISAQLAKKGDDPGAQMIYAMTLFRSGLITDAYREMLKAEAMAPRDALRCWVMFQFSLVVGDKAILEREAQHLANDPLYNDKAKKILERVRERG